MNRTIEDVKDPKFKFVGTQNLEQKEGQPDSKGFVEGDARSGLIVAQRNIGQKSFAKDSPDDKPNSPSIEVIVDNIVQPSHLSQLKHITPKKATHEDVDRVRSFTFGSKEKPLTPKQLHFLERIHAVKESRQAASNAGNGNLSKSKVSADSKYPSPGGFELQRVSGASGGNGAKDLMMPPIIKFDSIKNEEVRPPSQIAFNLMNYDYDDL